MRNVLIIILLVTLTIGVVGFGYVNQEDNRKSAEKPVTKEVDVSQDKGLRPLKPGKNEVRYISEGEEIVANLYLPEDYAEGEKRPAIVINPPATGVKEQTIGIYAEKLSHKGFVTLAFDPRGFGESEGHPQLQNPYRITEDIKNSVSFIRTLKEVDVDNVFSMGMCAGSGYAAYATAFDSRIKAVAIVSPFLTSADDYFQALGGSANLRKVLMPAAAKARQQYYETGEDIMTKIVPETEEEMKLARPITIGMREYYLPGKPGDVPNWKNGLSLMSTDAILSFSIFDFTNMFDAVPVYVVYGNHAITAGGAERFYQEINGPKDKLVIEGAGHFDLYWMSEYVDPAVVSISQFLESNIK